MPRSRPALAGIILGLVTTALYMIGSRRSFGYDAAATFANFIATPSLLDAFAVHSPMAPGRLWRADGVGDRCATIRRHRPCRAHSLDRDPPVDAAPRSARTPVARRSSDRCGCQRKHPGDGAARARLSAERLLSNLPARPRLLPLRRARPSGRRPMAERDPPWPLGPAPRAAGLGVGGGGRSGCRGALARTATRLPLPALLHLSGSRLR